MLRDQFIKQQKKQGYFRWRSHEVLRIEAFSDAVFAFAVTLLIVSLEVPRSFDELWENMKGFYAFAICFTLLFQVWYTQYTFFRRYGLQDGPTTILNGLLIFIVLFFVYPLKFLFSMLSLGNTYEVHGQTMHRIEVADVPALMVVYGLGYAAIFTVFALLHLHAYRQREDMKLLPIEQFETKTQIVRNALMAAVGLLSVIVAILVPPQIAGLGGFVYILIGPIIAIFHSRRGKARRPLEAQHLETLAAETSPNA